MDITQGEFKDFFSCASGRSSRNTQVRSRMSSQGSTYSSMELLPSEQNNNPIIEGDSEVSLTPVTDNISPFPLLNDLRSSNEHKAKGKKQLSSSLSDHSSSSTSDNEGNDNDTFTELTQEEIEMQKAIKKMQKLDKILMNKMKHEREVKRERLLIQKNFYCDLDRLNLENKNGLQSDVANNTNKYLSLLPPSQQLDVLIEQNQNVEDFEPIFQTQVYSTNSASSLNQVSSDVLSENCSSSCTGSKNDSNTTQKRDKKTKSASSGRQRLPDDGKTNFIERNIELAKDAGSTIAMTAEEKKRLETLLEDIDENLETQNEVDNDSFRSQLAATRGGEGYTPNESELTQLQEIDDRLQSFLSPTVYAAISSSALMSRNLNHTSNEMIEIGRKIAKAKVTETLSPEQRLHEIEEKLSQLNEKWKEKFDVTGPRLSDEQIHCLLDDYSRSTSPASITTSNLSKLDFLGKTDHSSGASFGSDSAEVCSISNPLSSDFRCSSRISGFFSNRESVISKTPVLEKHVLEDLLREAKLSLGVVSKKDVESDSDKDEISSNASSHVCQGSIPEEV